MKKEFVRARSAQDIIISIALLIIGCVIVVLPTGAAINIVGIFSIFAGILLIVILKSAWKDKETGEKYRKKEFYFPQSSKDRILKSVSSDIENIDIQDEDKGNGLRLDVFYSKKSGKSFVQVYEYIPYRYEPASDFFEYTTDDVAMLLHK